MKTLITEASNRMNLKNQIGKIIFLLLILLFPISLSAQITIIEEAKKEEKKPGWYYLKDVILAPYDSSDVFMQVYPLWEAYKKYIGQRLFFISYYSSDQKIMVKKEGEIVDLTGRIDLAHKYFDILDVMCAGDKNSPFYYSHYDKLYYYYLPENKKDEVRDGITKENLPYFILKDIQSNDTLYCYLVQKGNHNSFTCMILVSGYEKRKKLMIGQNIVRYDGYFRKKSTWQCIDISIATSRSSIFSTMDEEDDYIRQEKLVYVLQNKDDATLTGKLPVEYLKGGRSGWTDEESFQIYDDNRKQRLAQQEEQKRQEEQKKERERQERQKESAQEKAKRKQELTTKYGATTANKIIAGNFEIGMSKAVCREVCKENASMASTIEKTANAETWEVKNLIWDTTTYLYFTGDKLVRIVR